MVTPVTTTPTAPQRSGFSRRLRIGLLGAICAGIVAQFVLAGWGAFGAESFTAHETVGHLLLFTMVIGFLLTLAVDRRRKPLLLTGGLAIAGVVQVALAALATHEPYVGGLHASTALLVAVLAQRAFVDARRLSGRVALPAAGEPDGPLAFAA
jgi:hypothetical protein